MIDQPIYRKEDAVAPAGASDTELAKSIENTPNFNLGNSLINLTDKMRHEVWKSKHQDQIKTATKEKEKARADINNTLAKAPKNKYTKAEITSAANSDRGQSLTELATMPVVRQGSSAPSELKQGKSNSEGIVTGKQIGRAHV